jgi:Na+/melibiose symporter-like transporter
VKRWVLSLALGTVVIVVQSFLIFAFREPNGSYNLQRGYAVAGVVMGVFLLTPGLVVFLFVKEPRIPKEKMASRGIKNVIKGLKITLTNVPFLLVVLVSKVIFISSLHI